MCVKRMGEIVIKRSRCVEEKSCQHISSGWVKGVGTIWREVLFHLIQLDCNLVKDIGVVSCDIITGCHWWWDQILFNGAKVGHGGGGGGGFILVVLNQEQLDCFEVNCG